MKTSGLTGAALDWAVASIECDAEWLQHHLRLLPAMRYSTDWYQGGPIIEREKIFCKPTINKGWRSYQRDPVGNGICHSAYGPTPLIAAMRCYVASKRGSEVELPQELA